MLRKIDKPIECCRHCPYCLEVHKQFCKLTQDTIKNISVIPDNCPLPDAGVKTGCVVMIVRDGKVLLGERGDACQTAKGVFAYPGGRMEFGQTPKQSAVREVFEETGLILLEKELTFLRYVNEYFPEEKRHYVSLVFMAKSPASEGDPINKEPTKCKGWGWYDPDKIPENVFWAVRESTEMFRWKIAGA